MNKLLLSATLLIFFILVILLSGCTTTNYMFPDGKTYYQCKGNVFEPHQDCEFKKYEEPK